MPWQLDGSSGLGGLRRSSERGLSSRLQFPHRVCERFRPFGAL